MVDVSCTSTGPKPNLVVLVTDVSHVHSEVWKALSVPLDLWSRAVTAAPR